MSVYIAIAKNTPLNDPGTLSPELLAAIPDAELDEREELDPSFLKANARGRARYFHTMYKEGSKMWRPPPCAPPVAGRGTGDGEGGEEKDGGGGGAEAKGEGGGARQRGEGGRE